ncbi:MAG: DAK2 domain-containing protein, partial [Ruminococcus sp.]|nr:DAK2 domain-containing protein [Ruminococcus sp.]
IFEGMLSVIKDGVMIEYSEAPQEVTVDTFDSAAAEFDDDIQFTYCTEFIVGRNAEIETDPQELRDYLQTIGDCVVVVNDDEIIKVHVHTETPGNALTKGLEFGQLLTVKVENMKEQHKNAKNSAKKKKPEKEVFTPAEPTEKFGFVAVAAGEGMKKLFRDLGCNNIVSGGQSMNPSTDDIYEAVMATPAQNVFVLPNNKNIILAAEQTVPMVNDRNVIIVPTRTIPQGMTAMLNFDPEISSESNSQLMMDAARAVGTGLVTFAARNSEFGGRKIKAGDIIALENGKLTITEKNAVKALVKLAKSMVTRETQFITLIYGEEIGEEEANKAYEELREKFGSRTDISLVKGDQPVYYFILSVE